MERRAVKRGSRNAPKAEQLVGAIVHLLSAGHKGQDEARPAQAMQEHEMSRPEPTPREQDHPIEIPTVKARSGRATGHVRVILGVSLFFTVIAMGIVLLIWTVGT